MRSRRKNSLSNRFQNTDQNFSSLIPQRPKPKTSQEQGPKTAYENPPKFAANFSRNHPRAQNFDHKISSSVLENQGEESKETFKKFRYSGQIHKSTSITESYQSQQNSLQKYQEQHYQDERRKGLEPMQTKKIPCIQKKIAAFTLIEPRVISKVQPKIAGQSSQLRIGSRKDEPPAIEEIVLKTTENQRPLDQYARQVMNLYKKELRKVSLDTQGSDHYGTESDDYNQDLNMIEQIERHHTILEFRLGNVFQKVIRGNFQRAFWLPYSTHYEYSKAKKYTPPAEKIKEVEWITLDHLKVLNINLDLNIQSRGDFDENFQEDLSGYKRKKKVYYGGVSDKERAEHFIEIIKEAMFRGVDFILLQEGYQTLIRSRLLTLINELACRQYGKYFYPENIENLEESRATLILSKHPVRFGQLKFQITDYDTQDPKKFYFPLQAFCQFEILVHKKIEKIGILNCHLRSNGERNSSTPPWRMRQKQIDCIHDWGKRQKYDRFFVIGDTNMPSGQKFKSQNIEADAKFFDSFDQGFTPIGGTYLFRNERNEVVDERMDRVLMNKECIDKTVVEIQYEDVLLKSCEGKKLDKNKMLGKYEDQLIYITLSDHKIMDITIYMTNNK